MVVATYFCYEKMRTTMRTAIVSNLLNLVNKLTPLRLWKLKAALQEARIILKSDFLKIFKFSELRIRSSLFHSITAEGKKGTLKEIMLYFEFRNIISISCVVYTRRSGNSSIGTLGIFI